MRVRWFWIITVFVVIGSVQPLFAEERYNRRTPLVRAVEKVSPAVVNIYTTEISRSARNPFRNFNNNLFDQFFKDFLPPNKSQKRSLGSGVLINGEGFILTNEHVIAKATKIHVVLSDKQEFDASVIGADIKSDLAIIKIDSSKPLPYVEMGRSDDLMIGEQVLAIGNPFGLQQTVTTGIISALNRNIRAGKNMVYSDFIQVDASINPGNSGGPLLNINGSLIGINTAIYQKAEGIGFAIPIDHAKRIVDELIRYGKVRRGWMGVSIQELDPQLATHFQLDGHKGVLVVGVAEKSSAGKAGLKRGDIVIAIDGHGVSNKSDFRGRMASYTVGSSIQFSILRDGKKIERRVRVTSIPKTYVKEFTRTWFGLHVQENSQRFARANRLATDKGMVVLKVVSNSAAGRIGMSPGDVIRQLNQVRVDSEEDYNRAVEDINNPDRILLLVQRGRQGYYVTLEP
ncbi:MAG: Do family serine endopeptidase [Nitrospina sp.]|nr:Do family serine endopeptidase [Nitrospina sp.]MBT3509681.1 Do family serine endopeptidase [Nitrospina sp.]MBT3874900.1 Do family serine endopeptidase [Nitrospina sp.]MBT4048066.1 Do family serine endopeptidase [Nitrospina sp.]MBT4557707.1 Do family serine endopeptidase [Nitrospina sp.]